MDEVPPFAAKLLADGRAPLSGISARALRELEPLFAGGAIIKDMSGRGAVLVVRRPDVLLEWARRKYPALGGDWTNGGQSKRADAVLRRRDSKAGGAGAGASVLHLRATGPAGATLDGMDFRVEEQTTLYGLSACLIRPDTRLAFSTHTVLVENLACFLSIEAIIPSVCIALNSAGRISEVLLQCLGRATFNGRLLHLPDYDPVGLDDYLRLKAVLGPRVALFIPPDLEARFAAFGNKDLISKRPRNRRLLEALGRTSWPCPESAKVFDLIRESGSGLEQECLLLSR